MLDLDGHSDIKVPETIFTPASSDVPCHDVPQNEQKDLRTCSQTNTTVSAVKIMATH
jgi:hypothetical protein